MTPTTPPGWAEQPNYVPPGPPAPRKGRWLIPALVFAVALAGGGLFLALRIANEREEASQAGPAMVIPTMTSAAAPSPTPVAETISVMGYVLLLDDNAKWKDGQPCSGDGGFQDMRAGADVVVKDASGATVALGALLDGKGFKRDSGAVACQFSFPPLDVASDSAFFEVSVSHRDGVRYSRADLADAGILSLTLGSD